MSVGVSQASREELIGRFAARWPEARSRGARITHLWMCDARTSGLTYADIARASGLSKDYIGKRYRELCERYDGGPA